MASGKEQPRKPTRDPRELGIEPASCGRKQRRSSHWTKPPLLCQFPPFSILKRNYSHKGTMLKYKKPPSKFWGLGLFLPLDLLVLARLNRYPLRRRFIRTFYKKYHLLVLEIVSQSRSSYIRTVGGFSGRSIALESALALREATSVECSRHQSLKMRTRRIGDF